MKFDLKITSYGSLCRLHQCQTMTDDVCTPMWCTLCLQHASNLKFHLFQVPPDPTGPLIPTPPTLPSGTAYYIKVFRALQTSGWVVVCFYLPIRVFRFFFTMQGLFWAWLLSVVLTKNARATGVIHLFQQMAHPNAYRFILPTCTSNYLIDGQSRQLIQTSH